MKKKINKKYNEKGTPRKEKGTPRKDGKATPRKDGKVTPSKDRKVNNKPTFEGKIVPPIKNILLHVCLDYNNETVLGYLSGNLRRNRIEVCDGDKVLIELPESTSKKGRIIYRLTPRRVPSANQQTFMEQLENDQMEQLEDDQQVKEPSESSKDTETTNTITNNPLQPSETTNTITSNPLQPSDQEERRKEKRHSKNKIKRDSKDKNDN